MTPSKYQSGENERTGIRLPTKAPYAALPDLNFNLSALRTFKGMQFVPGGLWLYAKEPHFLFRTWGSPAVQSNPNAL